jgi:hypothetical protein
MTIGKITRFTALILLLCSLNSFVYAGSPWDNSGDSDFSMNAVSPPPEVICSERCSGIECTPVLTQELDSLIEQNEQSRIMVGSAEVTEGGTVIIPISVSNLTGAEGVGYSILFDPGYLEVVAVTITAGVTTNSQLTYNVVESDSDATLSVVMTHDALNVGTDTIGIAEITLKAKTGVLGETELIFANAEWSHNFYDISFAVLESGAIIITVPDNELSINLSAGWNLISIPYTEADYNLPSPNPIQIIYWYNPTTRMYEVTQLSELVPGKAYWLASTSTFQMGVKGVPASPITTHLSVGWNLVGGTDADLLFSSITIDPAGSWAAPFVYRYDPISRVYTTTTTLEPGQGYWGAVTRNCTITIST